MRFLTRFTSLAMAALAAFGLVAAAPAAEAGDRHWRGGPPGYWYDPPPRWVPAPPRHYAPPPRAYYPPPGYYYAPPPRVVVPPPRYYYPPPPPPGVGMYFRF